MTPGISAGNPSPRAPFSNQPTTFCMHCGMPIKNSEIALRVRDGAAIDYEDRGKFHDVIFHYCSDCKAKKLLWYSEGIRGAVERQKAIQQQLLALDKEDQALSTGGVM